MNDSVALEGFGGGGGAALNFKVVGGVTQPSDPSENTIWVNTDVAITGYYFQPEQPENMAEGEVWISTGTASQVAFNALKKGTVMVYPISAKQYVSGAWVDKTAQSYQNGAWVDWIRYFLKGSNTIDDITGGWVCRYTSNYASGAKITDDGLYTKQISAVGAYVANWYTESKVDLTKYKKIFAKMSTTVSVSTTIRLGLSDENTDTGNNYDVGFSHTSPVVGENIIEFDCSNVTGSHYIKLNYQGGGSADVYWKEVWGE